MIRLAVAGAAGRMGKTILTLANRDSQFRIVGGLEHAESPVLGSDLGLLIGSEPLGAFVTHNTLRPCGPCVCPPRACFLHNDRFFFLLAAEDHIPLSASPTQFQTHAA